MASIGENLCENNISVTRFFIIHRKFQKGIACIGIMLEPPLEDFGIRRRSVLIVEIVYIEILRIRPFVEGKPPEIFPHVQFLEPLLYEFCAGRYSRLNRGARTEDETEGAIGHLKMLSLKLVEKSLVGYFYPVGHIDLLERFQF